MQSLLSTAPVLLGCCELPLVSFHCSCVRTCWILEILETLRCKLQNRAGWSSQDPRRAKHTTLQLCNCGHVASPRGSVSPRVISWMIRVETSGLCLLLPPPFHSRKCLAFQDPELPTPGDREACGQDTPLPSTHFMSKGHMVQGAPRGMCGLPGEGSLPRTWGAQHEENHLHSGQGPEGQSPEAPLLLDSRYSRDQLSSCGFPAGR